MAKVTVPTTVKLTPQPGLNKNLTPRPQTQATHAAYIEALKEARAALIKAQEAFVKAEATTRHGHDADARHFMYQINGLLNSDHGEAGLEPFINAEIDNLIFHS